MNLNFPYSNPPFLWFIRKFTYIIYNQNPLLLQKKESGWNSPPRLYCYENINVLICNVFTYVWVWGFAILFTCYYNQQFVGSTRSSSLTHYRDLAEKSLKYEPNDSRTLYFSYVLLIIEMILVTVSVPAIVTIEFVLMSEVIIYCIVICLIWYTTPWPIIFKLSRSS